jgi:glyoxylase-like metal-dependent hydrolase (beta-lactamase superfamily II)
MNIYAIDTGFFKLDGGAMFGVVPKSIWGKLNTPDEANLCSWAMRCLLIEDGKRLILIDTGIGNKQDPKFFNHYYLHGPGELNASLKKNGFHADDITDVFLTHLHFDHCGGCIMRVGDRLLPTFKNAIYWSNDTHWKWAMEPNDREKASFLKENILPIKDSGQLSMMPVYDAANKAEHLVDFTTNIQIGFFYGHTQAMMLPYISYKGKKIVFMADLLPSIAHIPIPYIMAYDTYPLTSMNEKKSFLQEAQKENWVLFFEHDPGVECCDLQMTEKGVRSGNSFTIREI